jgi:hypothetical protein
MHCFVNMRLAGFGNLRDHGTIRRIYVRKLALPGDEPAIDVILD